MSRETKIGLLVATGIILTFAFILQMQLAGEPLAPLDHDNEGLHLSQRQVAPQPLSGPDNVEPDDGQPVADGGGERLADGPAGGHDAAILPGDDPDESVEDTGLFVVQRGPAAGDQAIADNGTDEQRDGPLTGDDRAVEVEQVAARTYTVVAGDSLYRIAEKEFGPGKGAQWHRIAEANPELRNPTHLRAGMVITIPSPEPQRIVGREPVQTPEARDVQPTTGPRTYVVQAGDTLGEISQKELGTSKKWQMISQANGNLDPASLRVGQKLIIPDEPRQQVIAQSDGPAIERALEEAAQFVSDSRQPTGIYRVRSGDSLYGIARRVLASGDRWKEIYELNRDKMSSPNDLVSGQVILVPALGQVAMAESTVH
ncbi:MAG: LysM peptidoglycan-binding domain-containing protein [Planctomycetes bacterium]|nr:LysM peptidoglycan-binding domain-containing protein [Planctomycetota bacterium]